MPGLTSTGFEAKTLETIQAELVADLKSKISATLNTDTDSPLGQLIGIFASQLRQVWELAQEVYDGQYPDSANGFSLAALAVLTGTQREPARASTVLATVNVDPGTYPVGSLVAHVVGNPEARFTSSVEVVNGGANPADVVGVLFTAEDTGAIRANAGTLTVRAEAVAGWNSVTNPEDATLGAVEEGDTALRLRREEELQASGSTTADALRVAVLDVADVTSATVLENDMDAMVDGIPPHAVEVIVLGGVDADVAAAILATKAGGIQAFGTTTEVLEDSQGQAHSVGFTRPTEVDIYLEVDLVADADLYGGDTAVKEALADYGDTNLSSKPGADVVHSRLVAEAFQVGGVTDITAIRIGNAPSPVSESNYSIGSREIADLDTARIVVNATLV